MKKLTVYAEVFAALNIFWYVLFLISSGNVPNPVDIFKSFNLFIGKGIYIHIFVSLSRIILGIITAVVVGGIAGYYMATSNLCSRLLSPLMIFANSFSRILFLPTLMLILILMDTPRFLLIALLIIFQIIVSVRDSVKAIDSDTADFVMSLGAVKKQKLRYLIIPEIIPGIVSCIKASTGTILAMLVFCEGYGTTWGMGYCILNAWSQKDFNSMFTEIIILSILGVVLFLMIVLAETKLVGHKRERGCLTYLHENKKVPDILK